MAANTTSLPSEFKFKDGTARNTPRIPKAKWDEHKELLCSLYQDMTVDEIVEFMQTEHGFFANAGQVGRKLREWGLYKYDSRNRLLISARVDMDTYYHLESVPVVGSDVDLGYPAEQYVLDTDQSAQTSPAANSGNVPDINSEILSILQAWETIGDENDIVSFIAFVLEIYHDSIVLARRILDSDLGDKSALGLPLIMFLVSLCNVLRNLGRQLVSGFEQFPGLYARGDSEIHEQLSGVSIAIRRDVISSLRSAFSVDAQVNYDASLSRLKEYEGLATFCLQRYSQRLSESAPENKSPIPWDLAPETLADANDWPGSGSGIPIQFDSLSTVQYGQPPERNDSSTVPMMPTVVKEAEHGRLSDIDMDRFSAVSFTSSVMSGFASLRSLALRIKRGESPSARNSADELPSSVMKWDRWSDSLHLFGRLSARLSGASSRRTDSSRMSWKPEIPETIQENDGTHHAKILPQPGQAKISSPENPVHVMHVMQDNTTGEFKGLPKDWELRLYS